MRLCMPNWDSGRLVNVYCTECGWTFPVDEAEAELPTLETAFRMTAAYDAHDCAAFPTKHTQAA